MAMAAPAKKAAGAAAKKVAPKAAPKAAPKNVTPKKAAAKKPPVVAKPVARQANMIANKQIAAGISTQAHQQRTNISTAGYAARQQTRVQSSGQIHSQRRQINQYYDAQNIQAARKTRRNDKIKGAAIGVAKTPFEKHDTVSVGPNPIMLIIFTMAGVIILYAMITTPKSTSDFFESMRVWVKLFYTTDPIFSVKNKTAGVS